MKNLYFIVVFLFIAGCGGGTSDSDGKMPNPSNGSLIQPFAVYNQAYQENYEADTLLEIFEDAEDAYVLIDSFMYGVSKHIPTIKASRNHVSGYVSVGTGEVWREDFSDLEPFLSLEAWAEHKDEYFISETDTGILDVMKKRIDKMAEDGIDWVEFDNMDWLTQENKADYNLTATVEQSKVYSLCDYTHAKGMKCMAKNTLKGFANFDGVVYESYSHNKNWWDAEGTYSFLNTGKPVIINHYNETNCDAVYNEYKNIYMSNKISFICEDTDSKKYIHYNQD